jgi:peptide/nickel transport system permease protein
MLAVAYGPNAPWNETRWKNDKFNRLLDDARAETDDAKRKTYLWEMQAMLHDDGGALIPAFRDQLDAHNAKVGGHTPHGAFVVCDAWADPSAQHWLGLDNLRRDLLSRLTHGARMSIGLLLAITALSFGIGIISGFAAAVTSGWVDQALSRLVDLLLSMSTLIFAFLVLSVLGSGLPVLIVTIAVLDSTKVFRLARSLAVGIVSLEFVEAARLRGEGWWWIISRETLPNAIPPLTAEFVFRFCFNFLFIAALSFPGLGIQPPAADWGSMVTDYLEMINFGSPAPHYPAAAIAALTIGVNFVVDRTLSIHSSVQGEGV